MRVRFVLSVGGLALLTGCREFGKNPASPCLRASVAILPLCGMDKRRGFA